MLPLIGLFCFTTIISLIIVLRFLKVGSQDNDGALIGAGILSIAFMIAHGIFLMKIFETFQMFKALTE